MLNIHRIRLYNLEQENSITNEKIRELCGFTKQQARVAIDKMRAENILKLVGKGKLSRYIKVDDGVSFE